MKKPIAFLCALGVLLGGVLPAQAAPSQRAEVRFHDEQAGRYGEPESSQVVNVTLNGATLASDVPAVTRTVDGVDGRTLVPVRPIAEALGATVLWKGEERQVVISAGADTLILTLGSARAVVNGREESLPGGVPAVVAKYGEAERTLVPLRFVSEQLHAQVTWDGGSYTAQVTARDLSEEPVQPPMDAIPPWEEPLQPPPGTGTQRPGQFANNYLLRVSADDNAQTITLYLNAQPRYRVTDLGDRVAIDLLGFATGSGQDGSFQLENPVVTAVRYANHGSDVDPAEERLTRVVLDLAKNCTYAENVTVRGDADLQAVVVTVKPPETGAEGPTTLPEDWDHAAYTVVLDAGHGGSASGALYEDVMEKDLTLPMTLRTAQLLEEKGYNVVLTRDEDVYMDLYDRCHVANRVGADIFVSIHCNASSTNRDFQGLFTYSYPGSVRGEKLAGYLQEAVAAETGAEDRGLLTNDYVVLRETVMPAALVETGFMSCHEELERLVRPEYQEKVAQGVAKGVEQYLSTLPAKGAGSGR